jgi:tRNA-dihydrouridine synthase
VRLEPIADVKRAVSIPVVGNGDVVDGKSAENMIKVTGCDMVMVGRAAMGAPWIFSQINAYLKDGTILPEPTVEEKMNYLLEQGKLVCEYKPEKIAMLQMRKHASWYIKGYKGAAKLREKCANLVSVDGLKELVDEVLHQSTME